MLTKLWEGQTQELKLKLSGEANPADGSNMGRAY